MKLLHLHTGQPLLEFREGKTWIYNSLFEAEMREMGIPIPPGVRSLYHGKECVYLEEADFQKAFKEIYYLTLMDPSLFKWVE